MVMAAGGVRQTREGVPSTCRLGEGALLRGCWAPHRPLPDASLAARGHADMNLQASGEAPPGWV